ncbi:helix-turn-helix domain-containing protein [Blastococcus litoris]|uniref:helix-turn-helix domain-containing protein n=1 Tax=Blastococcus litoris TaxID=2171622 RepID=UPI0013DE7BD7|nr:helix-turn-helix transcriptional regulator [Blastococcus litoris]
MERLDLAGVLRRIRRCADLSQRQLAETIGISKSSVAGAESGRAGLDARILDRAAAAAGLRLALLDAGGREVPPMAAGAVRDRGNRRFPAHLDVRYGDEDWWHGEERYAREQPWYTFDRLRYTRDHWRERTGTADDHRLPRPGDSPAERAAARREAVRRQREEEHRRRLEAGELRSSEDFVCACPPRCDELDDWSGRPVHTEDCPCSCDIG